MSDADATLRRFHPCVRDWFRRELGEPTRAQKEGWPAIDSGESALLLAPTGSGKTLAAFLCAIDRLIFSDPETERSGTRVLYISPLKALASDVERNLRRPIRGITELATNRETRYHEPSVGIRTGDTTPRERERMRRHPPEILITTPESLYLILTSRAREMLGQVETVIIDEIHAMVASKRGTHLALSLERLEALRPSPSPVQRVGLSATQRPLDEVARFLGGGSIDAAGHWVARPVKIVDAGERKRIELSVEVDAENMARLDESPEEHSRSVRSADAASPDEEAPKIASIWPSIHRRLVALIKEHRSTLIFVNNRRLAERLAGALNDEAGDELALAHHGSLAHDRRRLIEDQLKRGDLPAMVATSSLELGIDMGAIDLVVQIESPPSVASGLQRIGRANHSVGEVPKGVVFPKFRADLLACAAASVEMLNGRVESSRYPRNPLDVLAQQLVAIVAMEPAQVEPLYEMVRCSAPFADLARESFESVLDMLSGRYPSDEFRDLRARLTWDRVDGVLHARAGAHRIAVTNPGTIPDRGLYGVFLRGAGDTKHRRVGELDEEMVFESKVGDVFTLGASSWRIDEITHDRVFVLPAPGELARMPFWHGDRPWRPLEFGLAIGRLTRDLANASDEEGIDRLTSEHHLGERAATNLVSYVRDQAESTGVVPTDECVVIERFVDDVGDWRICVLTPFGGAVHSPWATAIAARLERGSKLKVEFQWSDDGFIFRIPASSTPPEISNFLIPSSEAEQLITERLATTQLFAARFRENASRALLLPRRSPGKRYPLWVRRKRASDLLSITTEYPAFPIVLETYRECLQDSFDLEGLKDTLERIEKRTLRVVEVETRRPSPFASSLLFFYVADYIYELDTPLAERRAHSLALDYSQLRTLLGEEELRSLFDQDLIDDIERTLGRLVSNRKFSGRDGLHDLLLELGDLTLAGVTARSREPVQVSRQLDELLSARRLFKFERDGETRFAAVEDASRLRDVLGIELPSNLPETFLEAAPNPRRDLVSRFLRTHGPSPLFRIADELGVAGDVVAAALRELEADGRIQRGAYLPAGTETEWCDLEVLRRLKQRALEALRAAIQPASPRALGRLLLGWHGIPKRHRGVEGLLSVLEQLEACPLVASDLETRILPARVEGYDPRDLDQLCASGEILWRGVDPIGAHDGRIAFYFRERYSSLPGRTTSPASEFDASILNELRQSGASFFSSLVSKLSAFRGDVLDALWRLLWAGQISNDTISPLRSRVRKTPERRSSLRRSPRQTPGSEGRWFALPADDDSSSSTEQRATLARVLIDRYGVLTKEAVHAESVEGGFSAVYGVLKAMEDAGKLRRGYFVEGLGPAQFAMPGAEDHLRSLDTNRVQDDESALIWLSATDPANPYGTVLPWPRASRRCERRGGARVLLRDGELLAYLHSAGREVTSFVLGETDEETAAARSDLARALRDLLRELYLEGRDELAISKVDGKAPSASALASDFESEGFMVRSDALTLRRSERLKRD